jgi:hypothetical protein
MTYSLLATAFNDPTKTSLLENLLATESGSSDDEEDV